MPHKTNSNYIHNSPWDDSNKQISRWITIIELYKELFQRNSIPLDRQYWSLCGNHTKNDKPIKGELGHLLEYDLIQKDQYYGVDREKTIIEKNKTHFPDINWIHGDFVKSMKNAILGDWFNPEIINYDGVMQPKSSVHYLKKIMKLIDYNVENQLMLICNFVLWNPYNPATKLRYDIHYVLKRLKNIYNFPKNWKIHPESYMYHHSHTKMGMIIFIKKP